MAGPVSGSTGALDLALAKIFRHPAKCALINLAVVGSRKGHPPMLKLINRLRGIFTKILDRILIAQPVRPFDGVIHMPAPVIFAHIAKRCRNPALGRDGVGTGRKHLGDAGGFQTGLRSAKRGPQPRAPGTNDDDVVGMVNDFVSG